MRSLPLAVHSSPAKPIRALAYKKGILLTKGEHSLCNLLGPTSLRVSNRHDVLFVDIAEISDHHVTPSNEPGNGRFASEHLEERDTKCIHIGVAVVLLTLHVFWASVSRGCTTTARSEAGRGTLCTYSQRLQGESSTEPL